MLSRRDLIYFGAMLMYSVNYDNLGVDTHVSMEEAVRSAKIMFDLIFKDNE